MPKDKPPGDIERESLQQQRDHYHQLLLEQLQGLSLAKRTMTRIEHQIHRIEENIERIDALSKKHNIELRTQLED